MTLASAATSIGKNRSTNSPRANSPSTGPNSREKSMVNSRDPGAATRNDPRFCVCHHNTAISASSKMSR